MTTPPRIAITLGDITGIGPEILARAWASREPLAVALPFVVGHAPAVQAELDRLQLSIAVQPITSPDQARPSPSCLPVLETPTVDLDRVQPATIDPRAGRAAYDFLTHAAHLALNHQVDALVTLPLHKEALHAAGVPEPGHTEILARLCGCPEHAMMLYVPHPIAAGPAGLGVVHVTLHVPLRQVFDLLTPARILAAIRLADQGLRPFTANTPPRIGVAGLNPHAGEHGLFGLEESELIAPAIDRAHALGLHPVGPIAADSLFKSAFDGRFDAVVAIYHDQGHVAIKTRAFAHAVNITLGLPIVRTSVAHGTAHDIVGRDLANPTSLIHAIRAAAQIADFRRSHP
ncbi:MAG: 4-hydroxythreonine-4-phosphate dehydrogenase [Isosphaeraceae bacterium]|jgi:4-hydroxythreonine-4-phosphate dehydrogenase|nr:MAG: 4-hydroxythreonine-4-phosphate dehydrogenase [Isosphaeraceae bacterium]